MRFKPFTFVTAALLVAAPAHAQQVTIDKDDIGGVVTGPNGPEAGVWVIAETPDLPTRLIKSVVTDDQGRYLIPELPKASYELFARGYGVMDSARQKSEPGRIINITVHAATPAQAAENYPAIYWYSMLKVPAQHEFPLGNAKTQAEWLNIVKTNGCYACHALGNKATRAIPSVFADMKSEEAWGRRILSGQAMNNMATTIGRLDAQRALALYADWTDRIAAGELPAAKPPRPQGKERNVVITQWDFSDPKHYLHDITSTDKRKPTVNANGLIYGAVENSSDIIPVLDPVKHTATSFRMPVRDPRTPSSREDPLSASPYWGEEPIWDSQTSTHNPMYDEKGQVWFTSRVGPARNPDFCRKGSDHPSAKVFPMENSTRHLAMVAKDGKMTLIRTCYQTHHLVFAEDADNTLWMSAGGPGSGALGWLNRRIFEETGDEQKAQGWTPIVLDSNGNGKRDAWVEPNQPLDPAKDKRILGALYGIGVNPQDGTIWGTVLTYPGYIIRVDPGPNPSETALAEIYEPPAPGFGPRGFDIDRNGLGWAPLASGHMASFDRRKCKGALNGPAAATGRHCPEGWTLYPMPGPQMQGVSETGSAEASYYTWVDQFDTFGLGPNVPWATGNGNESVMALVDGQWLNFVVPYPLGFYTKWMDGRIDDPGAGWKGRGIWATYGTRTPFHTETGKGTRPKVVKFQLRPDPLAR